MSDLKDIMEPLACGTPLTREEARHAFDIIMSGAATPAQIGAFLMALRVRGETIEELTAAAEVLRRKALPLEAPDHAVDTCGTGGDAKGSLNISTASAIVAAAAGATVAKHGNRSVSSKSGSADVLQELGINIEAPLERVQQALDEAGITFLYAVRHHAAMRHVALTRGEMGIRTLFNLVGPLSNPAGVKRQVLGVFSAEWIEALAKVLKELGSTHAMVVHGAGGMDELSLAGPNRIALLKNGNIQQLELLASDYNLEKASVRALKGGTPKHNAKKIHALLDGESGPFRDVVLLNTAATLVIAGKARDIKDGIDMARAAIDSGKAKNTLARWGTITRGESS